LEAGISSDGVDVAPVLLESTQSHLDQVVSALSVIKSENRSQTEGGPVDWQQVRDNLVQLRNLLEDSDTEASDVLNDLFGQLTEEVFIEPLKAVELVVDSYDFDMALDHLEELESLVMRQLKS
jgi:hypothetical protein